MLIINATIPYWKDTPRMLTDYALYIENGVIRAIGPTEVLIYTYRDSPRLDAHSQWVLAGNICTHTHFHHALITGLVDDADMPHAELPLSQALDNDALYWSATLCAMDAIKRGTTTLFNFHTSPTTIEGSLESIARAMKMLGMRAVLTYSFNKSDALSPKVNAHAENERFAKLVGQYDRIASGAQLGTKPAYIPRPVFSQLHTQVVSEIDTTLTIGAEGGKYDMWEEWRSAHRLFRQKGAVSPQDILQMGIVNNADLLMHAFPNQKFGDIAEGMTADIIFVDYHAHTAVHPQNIAWHLLYGIESWMVDTTIIGGEVVMRHRQLMALDEGNILKEARAQSQKVWERYNALKQPS
ncbi:MAG: amidohydrolase family protein [bacterium]|nr:amidohydrolase family protein [bacterium]